MKIDYHKESQCKMWYEAGITSQLISIDEVMLQISTPESKVPTVGNLHIMKQLKRKKMEIKHVWRNSSKITDR